MSAISKNLANAIQALLAAPLAAANIAATTWVPGTTIDFQGAVTAEGDDAAFLALGSVALSYKLQTSPDGTTWTDVAGTATAAPLAANAPYLASVGTSRLYRYIRVAWYSATATTASTVAAAYLGYALKEQPVIYADGTTYIALGN